MCAPLGKEYVTYRYELDNSVSVLNIFLNVNLEGSAHHGVDENVLRGIMVGVRLRGGLLLLDMIALCTTVRGTNGCHGSCPEEHRWWLESSGGLTRPPAAGLLF